MCKIELGWEIIECYLAQCSEIVAWVSSFLINSVSVSVSSVLSVTIVTPNKQTFLQSRFVKCCFSLQRQIALTFLHLQKSESSRFLCYNALWCSSNRQGIKSFIYFLWHNQLKKSLYLNTHSIFSFVQTPHQKMKERFLYNLKRTHVWCECMVHWQSWSLS